MDKETNFFEDYKMLMLAVSKLSKTEKNPFFNSSYTPLKDVLAEAKKVCFDYNFIFIQYPHRTELGNVLRTELIHKSGTKVVSNAPLVAKDGNDPQKVGSGITYMRRYSLTSILGIEEEDDDANKASNNIKQGHPF